MNNTISEIIAPEVEHFRRLIDHAGAELHCAKPGIVQSFDGKGTVTVLLAIKEKVLQNDMTVKDIAYPILVDVPVIMQRSGGFKATMPIVKGDECLVIFADSGIDWWWQSGGCQNKTQDLRRHDLSDGFAIFGPWSIPRNPSTYPSNSARIGKEDDSAYFEVTSSGNINVVGQTLDLSGSTVNLGSNTTVDGKNFLSHSHSGVQGGASDTGPVV